MLLKPGDSIVTKNSMPCIKKIIKAAIILSMALLCFHELSFIFLKAGLYFKGFQAHHFNYEEVRQSKSMPGAKIGIEAKKKLPPEAVVEIPNQTMSLLKTAVRYHLFPIHIKPAGTHVLDLGHDQPGPPPPGWQKHTLSTGINIYAKENQKFINPPDSSTLKRSTLHIVLFSLSLAAFYLFLGRLVLNIFHMSPTKEGPAWFYSTSYLIGYLATTTSTWVWLLSGGQLTRHNVLGLWAGLAVIFGLLNQRRLLPQGAAPHQQASSQDRDKLTFLSGFFAFALAAAIWGITVMTPVRDWDGMSHWIMKSKVIFHHKQLIFDYTHHNLYPLLWPLNIALQFTLLDGIQDETAQWTAGFLFIVFLINIFKAFEIMKIKKLWQHLIIIIYVASAAYNPFNKDLTNNFVTANAENLLMAYLTACLTAALLWMGSREEKKYLLLTLTLAGGLCLSKMEGFLVALFMAGALFSLTRDKRLWTGQKQILFGYLLVGLLPFLWILWVIRQGYGTNFYHLQSGISLEKIILLSRMAWQQTLKNNLILISGASCVLTLLNTQHRRWSPQEKFLLVFSIPMLLFSLGANSGHPPEGIASHFPDSYARLFLHATPALLLLLSSLVTRPEGKRGQGDNT